MFKQPLTTLAATLLMTSVASADVYSLTCLKSTNEDPKTSYKNYYSVYVDPGHRVLVFDIDKQLVVVKVTDVEVSSKNIKIFAVSKAGNPMLVQTANFANFEDVKQFVSSINLRTGIKTTDECSTMNE